MHIQKVLLFPQGQVYTGSLPWYPGWDSGMILSPLPLFSLPFFFIRLNHAGILLHASGKRLSLTLELKIVPNSAAPTTDAKPQEDKAESVSPRKRVKGSLRLGYVMVGMIFSVVRLDDNYNRYLLFLPQSISPFLLSYSWFWGRESLFISRSSFWKYINDAVLFGFWLNIHDTPYGQ